MASLIKCVHKFVCTCMDSLRILKCNTLIIILSLWLIHKQTVKGFMTVTKLRLLMLNVNRIVSFIVNQAHIMILTFQYVATTTFWHWKLQKHDMSILQPMAINMQQHGGI